MKRILGFLTAVLTAFAVIPANAEGAADKAFIYVSVNAEDGDGTMERPFGSFEEARDCIRRMKAEGTYPQGGAVVYFREGIYYIDGPLTLEEQDSGTADAPIVYRSYMEEQVSFVGGTQIDFSEFSPVTDENIKRRLNTSAVSSIRQFDLKERGITDYGELNMFGHGRAYYTMSGSNVEGVPIEQPPEVFFDSDTMILARYPNDDYLLTGTVIQAGDQVEMWTDMNKRLDTYVKPEDRTYPPKPSIFTVDANTADRMRGWGEAADPWVFGYFKYDWSDISLPVANLDISKGIVTTKFPSPKEMQQGKRYYFYNLLEELDTAGEYYIDRSSGMLYLYPPRSSGSVVVSLVKDSLVDMRNVSDVSFKGISLKASRNRGVSLQGCENIRFELCSVSKIAEGGMTFDNCKNCTVISCHVFDCGNGGVRFNFPKNSEYKPELAAAIENELIPVTNTVENCEINNFSRIAKTYAAAVGAGYGTRVINCKIHGGTHMGMTVTAENTIENNEFFDLLTTADDSGVIYSGYNKEKRNIVIRNNYFHDMKSTGSGGVGIAAVYADDLKDNHIVDKNLFVNIGGMAVLINGGRDHKVTNNIAVNCDKMVRVHAMASYSSASDKYSLAGFTFEKFLTNPAYKKYENFSNLLEDEWQFPKYNVAKNNVIVSCKEDISVTVGDRLTVDKLYADNSLGKSLSFSGDPGFADMSSGNYMLKEDSQIFKKLPEFDAPDYSKMGMYTGKLKVYMKDSMAFLLGSPKAYRGFTGEAISSNPNAVPFEKDGELYLPLRYIAETLGNSVTYNAETDEVMLDCGTGAEKVDGSVCEVRNDLTFVRSGYIGSKLGVEVKAFDGGVIVIGEKNKIGEGDTELLAELERRLSNM